MSPAGAAAVPADHQPSWEFPFYDTGHDEFRAFVRARLGEAVLPFADDWERQGFVGDSGWAALGAAGLLREAHSGAGFLRSAVLLEELGATGYAGIRSSVGVHAYMAASYLLLFGSQAQRAAWLPAAQRGERVTALAITEHQAGSDLSDLRTVAEPRPEGGFRLDGSKCYIANGTRAGLLVVLARTGQPRPGGTGHGLAGAGLLLVDARAPGVVRRPQPMSGYRSADIAEIDFDGVELPASALLGRPGRALLQLMRALDFERLVAGLLAVGGVRHTLELLAAHLAARQLNGGRLGERQAVRHQVADLLAEYDTVRRYAHHAAWLHAQGRLDTRTASVVKLRATELAVAAAQTCARLHGAQGCLESSAVARVHRDALAGTVAAGASELLRDLIAEAGAA
ncbi:acyl-CoA dehydrogenase family protein [Streptomonospora nanhaiensis]|uniref:Alkylation response protein AidB-like acyl-CoA dehydrogenase n=1 Tax=Streptomonospora nanhaiensis TaxID=1323731 RepID=A0A853BMB2_9ACTN|nr:acyl-CoA dehydrogenase family protein [Streptomonospora nanhaiensis]MBV2363326.1 acyl-CoA dehydrogenase family protein [Streptomonospora nanhaiensis]MBX9388533.1 acyl-CoA dehydrogenase family protein [Streptomonospora nanhaiensis]NYI95691.1 alkylation response protein AidB-like acyl-CoA dehydrogenase [Streptomonospora nanhaiensis]